MQQHTMRQFTLACCILGTAVFLGSLGVVVLGLTGTPASSLRVAATSIMVITLVLQLTFVFAQLFAAGRAPVPVPFFGGDAWPSVLVATGMPGVFWHRLASYSTPPVSLVMPGFATPLFIAVLFLFARQVQQRNGQRMVRGSMPVA